MKLLMWDDEEAYLAQDLYFVRRFDSSLDAT